MTTTGYGDTIPKSGWAKLVVCLQISFGFRYNVLFLLDFHRACGPETSELIRLSLRAGRQYEMPVAVLYRALAPASLLSLDALTYPVGRKRCGDKPEIWSAAARAPLLNPSRDIGLGTRSCRSCYSSSYCCNP